MQNYLSSLCQQIRVMFPCSGCRWTFVYLLICALHRIQLGLASVIHPRDFFPQQSGPSSANGTLNVPMSQASNISATREELSGLSSSVHGPYYDDHLPEGQIRMTDCIDAVSQIPNTDEPLISRYRESSPGFFKFRRAFMSCTWFSCRVKQLPAF